MRYTADQGGKKKITCIAIFFRKDSVDIAILD